MSLRDFACGFREAEVAQVLQEMLPEWQGKDYSVGPGSVAL